MASIVENRELVPNYEKCWRTVLAEKGFAEVGYRNPTTQEYARYLKVPEDFAKYLKQLDSHGSMYNEFKKLGNGDVSYEETYEYSVRNHLEAVFFRICGYTVNYTVKKVGIYKHKQKASDTIPFDGDEAVLLESSLPSTPMRGDEKTPDKDNTLLMMSTISHGLFKSQVALLSSENLVEFNEFLDKSLNKYISDATIAKKDLVLKIFNDSIIRVFDEWRQEKFES